MADRRCLQRVEILKMEVLDCLCLYGRPSLPLAGRSPQKIRCWFLLNLYGGPSLPLAQLEVRQCSEMKTVGLLSAVGRRLTPASSKDFRDVSALGDASGPHGAVWGAVVRFRPPLGLSGAVLRLSWAHPALSWSTLGAIFICF